MEDAMELKSFPINLFPNKNDVRYSEMLDGFSTIGIDSMSDLEFIDEEVPVTDSGTLEQVLSQIFIGTPSDRLLEIGNVLKNNEIYTGKDVLVIDTNKLRKEGALSNTELLKIEQYIKQHDKERFEDIRVEKRTNDKKELIEYETNMAFQ